MLRFKTCEAFRDKVPIEECLMGPEIMFY